MNRRAFIKSSLAAGALTALPLIGKTGSPELTRLSILYTIDTGQSPDDDEWAERMIKRAAHIKKMRSRNEHVLVADAGGMWGNGLYHHLYRGALEMNCLDRIGYDVATVGPAEFRKGQGALQQVLQKHTINWVLSNYDLSDSPLGQIVRPFMVETLASVRIGILALAPNPQGRLKAEHQAGIRYKNPLSMLEALVTTMRSGLNCRLIVVLSQLAQDQAGDEPGNIQIARAIAGIDLIVGKSDSGQTIETLRIASKSGYLTRVAALGVTGDFGRSDFYFDLSSAARQL